VRRKHTVQEKKGEGGGGEAERKKEEGERAEGEKAGGEEGHGEGDGDVRILSSCEGWLMSWMVPLASSYRWRSCAKRWAHSTE